MPLSWMFVARRTASSSSTMTLVSVTDASSSRPRWRDLPAVRAHARRGPRRVRRRVGEHRDQERRARSGLRSRRPRRRGAPGRARRTGALVVGWCRASACEPSIAAGCSIRRIPTAWLTFEIGAGHGRPRRVARGHTAVHPWEPTVTAEQIEHCHEAGILVNVWTCNDPDRFVALAAAGADGIITDVPDVMIAALAAEPRSLTRLSRSARQSSLSGAGRRPGMPGGRRRGRG